MEDIEKWPQLALPGQQTEPCQIVPIMIGQRGSEPPPAPKVKQLWEEQKPIDSRLFPHAERRNGVIPCTVLNVICLLKAYGIDVRYDVIRKKTVIDLPGWVGSPDNMDNAAMSTIVSLAEANNMQRGGIEEQVLVIGDRNMCNPAAEWMASKPWDGMDRLAAFYGTLTTDEAYPDRLKQVLIYKWLLSIVAAAFLTPNFRARGVLTLQGEQGLGKTAWVAKLVSDPAVREKVVKLDHYLDPHDKDSVLSAISHLIVEVGELDSSFRKDIARLKGFITRDSDKVRRPYARTASEYPRRTVFVATVNDRNFLVDDTGNSRFWTVPVVKVDYLHTIDMQQLYAQLHIDLVAQKPWWLTKEEEALLADSNRDHRTVSSIREGLVDLIDTDRIGAPDCRLMGTNDALKLLGIHQPRNGQNKEAAAVLRELLGEPRKYQGNMKWRVPLSEAPSDAALGTYSHLPLAEPCSPLPDSTDSEGF